MASARVPVHPLLVHFPIVLWLVLPVLDLAALASGIELWWNLALAVTLAGLVTGALAIATGLLEYIEPSVVGIDMRLAARHGTRTTLAWCAFAGKTIVVAVVPSSAAWLVMLCLMLDVLGCALLLQGVLYGTRQICEQLERS